MAVTEVNEKNFEEQVLKSDKAVLIDFNAGWCGPCRMLKPVIEQLSDELDGVSLEEESSYGGRMPACRGGS